jgi:hypothetical protein
MKNLLPASPFIFFLLSFTSSAQVMFYKEYHNISSSSSFTPVLFEAEQTSDGGYIIVSSDTTSAIIKPILIKTNFLGDSMWTKSYKFPLNVQGLSVVQTDVGGYVIGAAEGFVVRTDANGDTIWAKKYIYTGGPNWSQVIKTMDGKFVLCGINSSSIGGADVAFLKIDSMGIIQWSRAYILPSFNEFPKTIEQTSDSGFIIVGHRHHITPAGLLVKANSSGIIQWARLYKTGSGNDDYITSVKQTLDGGYILCGYTKSDSTSIFLIKTDNVGDTVWTRQYKGPAPNEDYAYSVVQSSDGGYLTVGTHGNSFQSDIILMKVDGIGNILWSHCYGDVSLEWGTSVGQTSDGGFVISGYTLNTVNNIGVLQFIKTDASGNTTCNQSEPVIHAYPTTFYDTTLTFTAASTMSGSGIAIVVNSGIKDSTICLNDGINKVEEQNSIKIYPNPSSGSFTISFNDQISIFNSQLSIYDVTGRLVYLQLLNINQETINCKLSCGIYFVKVNIDKGSEVKKLVVE